LYGKVLHEEFAELKLKHYNTYAGTKTAVDYTIWKSSDDNIKESKWDARLLYWNRQYQGINIFLSTALKRDGIIINQP